ncbi:MAG: hypothetical protein V7644_1079 [Actinomycetota bacterium]|jgi:hypothetical protein
MARPLSPSEAETLAYHGEVWTDGRGYATVRLPVEAGPLEPPLEYELRDLDPQSRARVTAELKDSRFTIATDEPHVKVGWRIRSRQPASQPGQRQQEEE